MGISQQQPALLVGGRPGLVLESEGLEPGGLLEDRLLEKVSGRGHIVKWAPQMEVLRHRSVGGFWTHCGWNSTLESVSEGVPMICMPFLVDQVVTARYVSDSWGVGLRLERGVKRDEVERVIRRLMVEEDGEEMRNRMIKLKEKARFALKEGGSSYRSLEKLVNYLLSL